ncbi:MAG: serine/threonine-protein kinase [Cyanobacteria bacterium P01_A01_bin.45]
MLLNSRYQVVRTLGSGGFGETFLAEDTQMPSGRKCVVKQLKPIEDNPQIYQLVQERFQREAAILEDLGGSSEQIPTLYAYFQSNEQFYLVQQYIQGKTLTEALREKGTFNEAQVKEILASLLPVLSYVHSMGIVHRDIKPDNIILRRQDNQPVLIDFGAVRETMGTVINSQGSPTSSIIIGTPGYMPSEQAMGRPTYTSDLYSLGMSAIYLLTGKQPQELQTDPNTGEFIWRQYVKNMNPEISPEIFGILNKAIAYHPRERFNSAQAMLEALQTSASTFTPTLPPTTPPVPSNGNGISENTLNIHSPKAVNPLPTIPQQIPAKNQTNNSQIPASRNGQKGIILGSLIAGSIVGGSIIVGMALNKPSFENSQVQNQKRTVSIESAGSNSQNNSQVTQKRSLTIESTSSQSDTGTLQNKPSQSNTQNNTISPQTSQNPPIETSPVNKTATTDSSDKPVDNSQLQISSDSNNSSSNNSSNTNRLTTNRPSPEQFVKNYYTAINQGEYRSSWDRLSINLQNNRKLHPQGYSSYTAWWGDKVRSVDLGKVSLIETNGNSATVDASLKYSLKTGRVTSDEARFSLSWSDSNQKWVISDVE